MPRQTLFGISIVSVIITTAIIVSLNQTGPQKTAVPLERISFAIPSSSFTSYSIYVALVKGYFEDEGLDVTLKQTYPDGKATLEAMIEGETEFAVSSEIPFILMHWMR